MQEVTKIKLVLLETQSLGIQIVHNSVEMPTQRLPRGVWSFEAKLYGLSTFSSEIHKAYARYRVSCS